MYQRDRRVVSSSSNNHELDEANGETSQNDNKNEYLEWHPFEVWRTRVLRIEDHKESLKPALKEVSSF